jgi:hypothetical protein
VFSQSANSATTRADPDARKESHDRIAAAMGDIEDGGQDAEYGVS